MSGARAATFGKKGAGAAQTPLAFAGPVRRGLLLSLGGGAVAAVAAVAAVVTFSQPGIAPSANASASAAMPSLNGLWATNAMACDVAGMKIELDGTGMTSVSALGRLPIGTYTLSGANPVTLTFPNGDHIVWDTTYENKLIPISISPDNGPGRFQMMHLTRCS